MTSLQLILLFLAIAKAQHAFDKEMTCEKGDDAYSKAMDNHSINFLKAVVELFNSPKENSYGTLGIVVGSSNYPGGVYFSAITALKIGMGNVKIFCNSDTAQKLKQYSPDLYISNEMDKNSGQHNYLASVDVVLIGPGLEQKLPNTALVKEIISYCRQNKKILVIDMSAWFWSDDIVKMLANYPESGVILIGGQDEFNRIYQPINPTTVELSSTKYGPNVYILRRGCMDRGISLNKSISWTSLEDFYPRYVNGQEFLLSGAVASLLIMSSKHVDPKVASDMGPMYHAAVATFTATKYIRKSISLAFQQHNRAMMTTDIIQAIPSAMK